MESKWPAFPQAARDTQQPHFGTILAFDFGERRIGVAVGELEFGIAHPLETIDAAANDARFARIDALLQEWRPVLLVVGLPMALDGAEHRLTGLARKFAQRLHGRFGIEIRLVDERLTSVEAQREARESGLTARGSKRIVDQLAAKLILEAFFNENA